MQSIKITVIGDGTVGKTCLLSTYIRGTYPTEYIPTVFEQHDGHRIRVDNHLYELSIWDTAGQEGYDRLRPLAYPNTKCFLLCFSVNQEASYKNIITRWQPELRHLAPTVPTLLVATKIDLRAESSDCFTFKDGQKLSKKIKAQGYKECSAKKNIGLSGVMEEAVRIAVNYRPKGRSSCRFL